MTLGSSVSSDRIAALSASVDGAVITPGHPEYEESRKIWNAMIDRHPALIVRCASEQDVVRAVALAAESGAPLAIRGGGHNVAGRSVCDGGIVIDLSGLDQIDVMPEQRLVRAGGGLKWGPLDAATQPFGLHAVGGVVSTTGVGGLTLGGGFGWLSRAQGLACDNLVAARVVTADGRILTASADENPDLFWGIRGGGGNFGVVTEFTFRLHEASTVLAGMLIHPIERARDALRFYREFVQSVPDELDVFSGFRSTPDGTPVFAHIVFYNGDLREGERIIDPLRRFGPPLADRIGPIAYVDQQRLLDLTAPYGRRSYWKSSYLTGLPDDAIDTLIAAFDGRPSPYSALILEQWGGAVAGVPIDETAFVHRDAPFNLISTGMWEHASADDENIAWTRRAWKAMQPWAMDAVYVNYMDDDEAARVSTAAYGSDAFTRLQQVKRRYDPHNLFRLNHNVLPAAV